MNGRIVNDYKDDGLLRESFNQLAEETFGLNFESWYKNGYWTEQYRPYSMVVENRVVSNVSVNLIDCRLNGVEKHYIQLGTVMTRNAYRNKGYCREILKRILCEYAACDGFFLYANDSVLDFYPKFGFQKKKEIRFYTEIAPESDGCAETVPMETAQDWASFLREKNSRMSNGILQLQTDGLLMFYLTQFMRNSVYVIRNLDAYVIAEKKNGVLILHDVFSKTPVDMRTVCNAFGKPFKKAEFAFVPQNQDFLKQYDYPDTDTAFFVRGQGILRDMDTLLYFPEIAHA